ncbi:hypothetical protein AUP68_16971 [Ilyonectria robusta]
MRSVGFHLGVVDGVAIAQIDFLSQGSSRGNSASVFPIRLLDSERIRHHVGVGIYNADTTSYPWKELLE